MLVPGTIVRQIHNIRIDTDEEAIRKKKFDRLEKGTQTAGLPIHAFRSIVRNTLLARPL